MNVPPPPEADNLSIKDLRNWCEELYRILQFPSFHNAYLGTVGVGNFTRFDTDGHMTMNGDATVWDDVKIPVNAIKPGASFPPVWIAYKGGLILGFADEGVNEDRVHFTVQLPHSRKSGSDIYPHIHWVGEDNTAGNVKWLMTYSWANIGEAFPGETTITVVDANADTDVHNLAVFDAIDGTDKTLSSMLICTLNRNSTDAEDTFAGKVAGLLEVDFHIEIDTIGSNQEYIK